MKTIPSHRFENSTPRELRAVLAEIANPAAAKLDRRLAEVADQDGLAPALFKFQTFELFEFAQPNLPAQPPTFGTATTRTLRTVLFDLRSERAEALRRELFEVEAQDDLADAAAAAETAALVAAEWLK